MSVRESGHDIELDHAQCDASRRTLVVAVHGLGGDVARMRAVIDFAREKFPGANVLAAKYPVGWLSNSDPFLLADRLEAAVGRHFDACERQGAGYDGIVLIGYSAGALLTRKAFIYGIGDIQDHPRLDSGTARPAQAWTGKVQRIVLIAGMNRGWSLDRRLAGMSLSDHISAKAAWPLAKLAGVSGFVFKIERGAPFVANLRLQWVRAAAKQGAAFPTVVQILGKADEFVSRQDEQDLAAAPGFFFIDAGPVTHTSIVQLKANTSAREALAGALTLDRAALSKLPQTLKRDPEDRRITQYIFVRHGIRDIAEWTQSLERKICEAAGAAGRPCKAFAAKGASGELTQVDIARYGYFGMLPFLIPQMRQEKVREFLDAYTEAVAKTANPDLRVDFVGHSHGTYLLAAGLASYSTMKVNKVVFADSVVNKGYRWDSLAGRLETDRVHDIRNYAGTRDWVVAIFPRLFEKWGADDLGSAGFAGFEQPPAVSNGVLLTGGHDIGISPGNHQAIADYLFDRAAAAPPDGERSGLVSLFWKFPELGWLLALGFGAIVVVLIARLLGPLTRRLPANLAKAVRWTAATMVLAWILVSV